MVQRYVLDEISDVQLKVYMVWLPINPGDTLQQARRSVQAEDDPRIEHFWIPDPTIPELFKKPLGMTEGSAWDVFLLYGRQAEWSEELPVPTYYMHQGRPLPSDRILDARKLADEARVLLMEAHP